MVNRSMEAKRIKYVRMSKARPRSLRINKGYMKEQPKIDRSKVPEEWLALFEYRERAKTFIDDFLTAKFGIKKPIEDEIIAGPYTPVARSVERDKVFVTDLMNTRFQSISMVSTSRMDEIYFIEYFKLPGMVRRSITYNSHSRAMQVFQLQTIRWKEVIHIPNVE